MKHPKSITTLLAIFILCGIGTGCKTWDIFGKKQGSDQLEEIAKNLFNHYDELKTYTSKDSLWHRITPMPDGDDKDTGLQDPETPFTLAQIDWIYGDTSVLEWKITVEIPEMTRGGVGIVWTEIGDRDTWKPFTKIKNNPNACYGYVAKFKGDDGYYGFVAEWILKGMHDRPMNIFQARNLWDDTKFKDKDWDDIEACWGFISGGGMVGQVNRRERSPLKRIK